MKKMFLVFALMVITVSASHAQHAQRADSYAAVPWRERPMRVGASLSGNVSMMAGMYMEYGIYWPNVGGGVGVNFNTPMAKKFNFQFELNYQALRTMPDMIGFKGSSGPRLGVATAQYLSVPMLFQFLPKPEKQLFVNFGPELKVCLANSERFGEPSLDDNVMEYTNRVVLAFNVGVGMHVPIAERWDFVWETRFAFDITNPRKKSEPFFVAGANTLVLSLHAGVAYRF